MLTKLYDDHSYVVMTHLHMKYESTVQYVVNRMLSFMVHYCTCKHLSHLAQQVHMKDISHFVSDHNLQLSLFPLAPNQVIVPERYRRDYDDIQGKFVLLFDEITELFENEESVTMSKLKRFLSRYPNLKASLGNADTIADVMDMIQEQSSFTCCSYLKHTATRFNITVAVEKINDYYKSVDEFCQHVLRHHVYMQPFTTAKSINITDSEIISFKLEWSPDTKTLSDIQSLLRHAFDEQSVYVRIVVVRGGSVLHSSNDRTSEASTKAGSCWWKQWVKDDCSWIISMTSAMVSALPREAFRLGYLERNLFSLLIVTDSSFSNNSVISSNSKTNFPWISS